MPYTYIEVDELNGKSPVGTGQCAILAQWYAKAPQTKYWKKGSDVKGNGTLSKGTAIATFVNRKYPNLPHGNHVALYLSQDAHGIWVMDQYIGKEPDEVISKRLLRFKGPAKSGGYVDPVNNGDAYSVIE